MVKCVKLKGTNNNYLFYDLGEVHGNFLPGGSYYDCEQSDWDRDIAKLFIGDINIAIVHKRNQPNCYRCLKKQGWKMSSYKGYGSAEGLEILYITGEELLEYLTKQGIIHNKLKPNKNDSYKRVFY